MRNYVLAFPEIDRSSIDSVGGKGANLGELAKVPGVSVPPGFCITTEAYREFSHTSPEFDELLSSLDRLDAANLAQLADCGTRLRGHLESLPIPPAIEAAIIAAWEGTGSHYAYAVRSSATAEDLPGASFAGQQETYLNVTGREMLLDSVRKCWASLFTDRAIVYRQQNGFDHRRVLLSVVVQRMVFPEVAGIMFTADPIGGNRKLVSIDASYGLGEALVSGLVSADLYQIREAKLVKKNIAKKEIAIYALPEGGTIKAAVPPEKQARQALADDDALALARTGRLVESHFGGPQDIEWCLADGEIFILQSRPITTLYPVPQAPNDKLHIFMSLGHAQMMTEAMKPLGISVLRTLAPFGKPAPQDESTLLQPAGGRLFIDLTQLLRYRQVRKILPALLLNVDQLASQAVGEFITTEEFLREVKADRSFGFSLLAKIFPVGARIAANILYRNHPGAIEQLNSLLAAEVEENRSRLASLSGATRIRYIQEYTSAILSKVFTAVVPHLAPAIISYKLIDSLANRWLGDSEELGAIGKSPAGNVTSEMGLALGDLADAVRHQPAVIAYLEEAADADFWTGLAAVPGSGEVLPLFTAFFERYGMRGTGEIDITRPRWREVPTQLVPAILSHIKSAAPGQHRRNFAAGAEEAERASARLLTRLRATAWGGFKARIMARLIKVHRSLIGVREHPKYFLVRQLDLFKKALLAEGQQLAEAGILGRAEDVYWLSLVELAELIETRRTVPGLIAARQRDFADFLKLNPPRVITSDGEVIVAQRGRTDLPPGALSGSPVSAGIVEGRARVVLSMAEARMDKGDILVAPFTDPSWTPLFPLASGLVTEVGGLMTHGAVVAREYGIPAVVGVDGATRSIRDGQRIRVNGHKGFVELLADDESEERQSGGEWREHSHPPRAKRGLGHG